MSVINSEWVMVPREPTEAMCKAGWTTEDPTPVGIWALMIEAAIAAAPQEPVAWATLVDDEVCAVSLTKMAANLRAENLRGENRGRDFVVSVAPLYAAPRPSAEPTLVQAARDALAALEDILNGWKYIRRSHGDLYGVGWDRAESKAATSIDALRRALDAPEAKGGGR